MSIQSLYYGSQLPIYLNISKAFRGLGISDNTGITGVNFVISDYTGNVIVTKTLGDGVSLDTLDNKSLKIVLSNSDYGTASNTIQVNNYYDVYVELLSTNLVDLEEFSIFNNQLYIRPRNISETGIVQRANIATFDNNAVFELSDGAVLEYVVV